MRSRQRFALGGLVAGAALVATRHQLAEILPPTISGVLLAGGVVIPLASGIPFLRATCPKCKQRYHSLASLFRHPDRPAPCKSCGFDIDKPIPRYAP